MKTKAEDIASRMPVDTDVSVSQTGVQNVYFLYVTQVSVSESSKTDS